MLKINLHNDMQNSSRLKACAIIIRLSMSATSHRMNKALKNLNFVVVLREFREQVNQSNQPISLFENFKRFVYTARYSFLWVFLKIKRKLILASY